MPEGKRRNMMTSIFVRKATNCMDCYRHIREVTFDYKSIGSGFSIYVYGERNLKEYG